MSTYFQLPDVMELTIGVNILYVVIAVLFTAGLTLIITPNNSSAHKLAAPLFISAAAAAVIIVVLRVVATWM